MLPDFVDVNVVLSLQASNNILHPITKTIRFVLRGVKHYTFFLLLILFECLDLTR